MKTSLILGLGILLAGCGSDATTSTATTTAPADTVSAASANPDPRVDTVRQQHQRLLSIQQEYLVQLGQLKGNEKLSPKRVQKSKEDYTYFIGQSQANLTALDQLDPAKAQDPAQVALVGEIAEKQASVLNLAKKKLAGIHNEHYLPQ
ncbi:hypothetical protein GCM10027594_00360 [Hymenobacter agri]|uniref:Lipoprotein n=1 Tax=Hymenobacter jeollabukensis TaxID=2025313 RepID=A0A5R8WJ58_9BACT|nr:hypothetical protein [Hymenobacter jeollabukensis]TLM88517.1 hypothetical protein FDY95_24455 [Hymenobacter jeollabukensis]